MTLGIRLASSAGMTPFASIPMWSHLVDCRSCHIHVYDTGCTVEMRALGKVAFTRECLNLDEAFEQAEALRKLYVPLRSKASQAAHATLAA
jgi:hypothetical protein